MKVNISAVLPKNFQKFSKKSHFVDPLPARRKKIFDPVPYCKSKRDTNSDQKTRAPADDYYCGRRRHARWPMTSKRNIHNVFPD